MIFETIGLLLTSGIVTLPAWLYHKERKDKKRIELEYRIHIAQVLGYAATLRDHETGAHNSRVTYIASCFGGDLGLDNKKKGSGKKGVGCPKVQFSIPGTVATLKTT